MGEIPTPVTLAKVAKLVLQSAVPNKAAFAATQPAVPIKSSADSPVGLVVVSPVLSKVKQAAPVKILAVRGCLFKAPAITAAWPAFCSAV